MSPGVKRHGGQIWLPTVVCQAVLCLPCKQLGARRTCAAVYCRCNTCLVRKLAALFVALATEPCTHTNQHRTHAPLALPCAHVQQVPDAPWTVEAVRCVHELGRRWRIHSHRTSHACLPCGRCFVSASRDARHHLVIHTIALPRPPSLSGTPCQPCTIQVHEAAPRQGLRARRPCLCRVLNQHGGQRSQRCFATQLTCPYRPWYCCLSYNRNRYTHAIAEGKPAAAGGCAFFFISSVIAQVRTEPNCTERMA